MAQRSGFKIGDLHVGGGDLLFILGPCVIESPAFTRRMAKKIKAVCDGEGVGFVFKASYDKANRTSLGSYRGISARDGCALLAEIGAAIGSPVTTDIHSPEEAALAAGFIDILQIPAFLCRQTDLIIAGTCGMLRQNSNPRAARSSYLPSAAPHSATTTLLRTCGRFRG